MISCVFCSCELPSRVGRAKYLEHLQDWHLITRPEEVARALHLAFPGEQEGAAMDMETAGEMAESKVQEEEEEEENSDDEVVIMELPQGPPSASPQPGAPGDRTRARAVGAQGARLATKSVAVVVSRVKAPEALARYRASNQKESGVVEEVISMVVEESSGHKEEITSATIKCDLCGDVLKRKRKDRLAVHLRMKHGAPKLKCRKEDCDREFCTTSGLNVHMKKTHTLVVMAPWSRNLRLVGKGMSAGDQAKLTNKVECPVEGCNMMFSKKIYLTEHVRRIHRVKEEPKEYEDRGKDIKVTLGVPMEEVQEAGAEVAEIEDKQKEAEEEKEEQRVEGKEARQEQEAEEELRLMKKENEAVVAGEPVQEKEAQEDMRVEELEKGKETQEKVRMEVKGNESVVMEIIEVAEDFQQKVVQEKERVDERVGERVDERDPLDLGSE